MAKQIIFIAFLVLLYSCSIKENQDSQGSKYIGNWHMEEIKSPKYPYYVHEYSITKNGQAFIIKEHSTCPKCKDTNFFDKTHTFSGNYNQEKNVFEIQKNGFQEILNINEADSTMISSRFSKFSFKKIK
jgi:predicted nucleic-acid-binding Zn-ribbon protein